MIKIVYFCEGSKKDSKIPVKNYIDILIQEADISEKLGKAKKAEKQRGLALRLLTVIKHAAEHDGIVYPPLGDKMHGYPLNELRQKHGKELIRIFYFVYMKNKLVLLHAYDKKEGTVAPKKEINIAYNNYKLYISNPQRYEF
ncbi:hypothetical protein HON22_05690 [Candidatus Peregrinibacteria bacterium]|jgi:phage-related protein|nr:hypothetical protein [Candidatus Peregrinibacteria bacterium]